MPAATLKLKTPFIVLVAAFFAAAGLKAAVIGEVKVEGGADRPSLKVVSTGKLAPAVSTDAGKVIIDLKGASRGSLDTLKIGRLGVKQVRFGKREGGLRIVVDTEAGVGRRPKVVENGESGFTLDLGGGSGPASAPKAASSPAEETAAAEEPAADVAALNPAAAGLTYRVVDISAGLAGDKVQVVISTDGPVNYKTAVKDGGKLLRLTLRNASLSWSAPSEGLAKAPVRAVRATQATRAGEPQVSIEISLDEKAPYSLAREQNQVVVAFERPAPAEEARRGSGNIDMPVTLEVEQADVVGVVKSLATQAGFEIDISKELSGLASDGRLVSFSANKRPLRDVLGAVLAPFQMTFDVQGGMMYVGRATDIRAKKQAMKRVIKEYTPKYMSATQLKDLIGIVLKGDDTIDLTSAIQADPRDSGRLIFGNTEGDIARIMAVARKLDAPEEGEEAAADSGSGGNSKRTKVFRLNYLDMDGNQMLSQGINQVVGAETVTKGDFVFYMDDKSRTLVATGRLRDLEKVQKLLERIDVKRPQVHVEGKIVEVSQDDAKAMGLTLNFDSNVNSSEGVAGLVNAIPPRGGLGLLTVVNTQNLTRINAQIDALVQHSAADIISSPSITIRDNKEAIIKIEDKVVTQSLKRDLVGNTITDTITFTEKPIPLELRVTPKISLDDMTVFLKIFFKLDNVTGEPSQAGAPPPTTTQETDTEVTVANTETAVIGGLMRDSITNSTDKVPVLGDIPLLGLLFRRDLTVKKKKEVIIFITPRIEEF